MPLYVYECGWCFQEFERLSRVAIDPDIKCPKCGSTYVNKRVTVHALAKMNWAVLDRLPKDTRVGKPFKGGELK